jgi:superoxide dismutase, Cu-Zn family
MKTFTVLFLGSLVACAGNNAKRGVAEIRPLHESTVSGQLVFTETQNGYRVEGQISGLSPNGVHGFHVHEVGDCSAPDGSSAKEHFDPHGEAHGARAAAESHVGDLGNIRADEAGVARISVEKPKGRLKKGAEAIAGRAIIVHARPDDLETQPAGDAGSRIGCGVIDVKQ